MNTETKTSRIFLNYQYVLTKLINIAIYNKIYEITLSDKKTKIQTIQKNKDKLDNILNVTRSEKYKIEIKETLLIILAIYLLES